MGILFPLGLIVYYFLHTDAFWMLIGLYVAYLFLGLTRSQ